MPNHELITEGHGYWQNTRFITSMEVTMEARNRTLKDWYGKIRRGEIKLPRFQRFQAWDKHRICSLIQTVISNLPLGITLVLDASEEEKFVTRFLETAPITDNRLYEYLLDGQQRLTAMWRTFHNNYECETYFIHIKEFDNYDKDAEQEDMSVFYRGRYIHKNGEKYPLWCDDPSQSLKRGYIPTHLLKPEDIQKEIEEWIDAATADMEPDNGKEDLKKFYDFKKRVSDKIMDLRSIVSNYNLPYLSLPPQTEKTVALKVFINMNTNSKPLTVYEIIVAEVESIMGKSLHDLLDSLNESNPDVARYSDLSSMILNTSALLQDALPNERGAWDMNKRVMVDNWDIMENGLKRMADFLVNQGIYDRTRLPTNAVLAVIAALYNDIPDSGDKRGRDELLLKKYLWYSFFTDRYENSAASHAFSDFVALKKLIKAGINQGKSDYSVEDVPIFSEHTLVEPEELLKAEWPKRATIRGRAILAVAGQLGAMDFSTGEKLSVSNIEHRHYHHIFPDSLLKEAEINSFLALNCAIITDKTNMSIGRKDPLEYMSDRYKWTSENIVRERLQSHMIPVDELKNGGYEDLSDSVKTEKLKKDFDDFMQKRANIMMEAVKLLVEGRQLGVADVFGD